MLKSLWASIQGDPVFMRRVNGWLTLFWIVMIPVSIATHWISSVTYVAALSLWALVSGHWSAWQAARVEVKQEEEEQARDDEDLPGEVVERIVEDTEISRRCPAGTDNPWASDGLRRGADGVQDTMTRYLCVHASHRRDGKRVPVDLTDGVRLERSLVPRPAVYLAVTEELVNETLSMRGPSADRRIRIEQYISGEVQPANLPVVLVSERSSDRTRGRYEWDDLRRDASLLDRLAEGPAGNQPGGDPNDDVILLEDGGRDNGGNAGVLTRARPRVRVIPQGIFDLHELAARIAIAGSDEEAVIDAIRTAPHASVGEMIADAPWRVVVPCAAVEPGELPHDVLFTGLAGREPAVIYGTTASGLDLVGRGDGAGRRLPERRARARGARRDDAASPPKC